MNKLFDDKLFVQKERPTKITKQQEEKLLLKLSNEVIEENFSSDCVEDIAEDLRKLSTYDSGYEMAKSLESNGNCRYDIDSRFIDWLDFCNQERDYVLNDNIRLWVKAHDVKSKYKKGNKLKVLEPLTYGVNVSDDIYITGVKSKEANYLIDKDPNRNGGIMIPFERVEQCCDISV